MTGQRTRTAANALTMNSSAQITLSMPIVDGNFPLSAWENRAMRRRKMAEQRRKKKPARRRY